MAARTGAALTFRRAKVATALLALGFNSVFAAELLSIRQALQRAQPVSSPPENPAPVTVRGTVSLPPTPVLDFVYLPIQDESGYGLILDAPGGQLAGFRPGDRIEASGVPHLRAGFPTLQTAAVSRIAGGDPPPPKEVSPEDLCGSRYQGTLIVTQTRVESFDENSGGETLKLRNRSCLLQVFLPRLEYSARNSLARMGAGDKVRVTGVAMKYVPAPARPRFQVLIHSASAVVLVERGWPVAPYALLIGLLAVIGLLGIGWMRSRHLARLRQVVRSFNEAGESALAAGSTSGILMRLSRQLVRETPVIRVRLFLLNAAGDRLESVIWEGDPVRHSYPVAGGNGFLAGSLQAAVRNKTLMVFGKTHRRDSAGETTAAGLLPSALLLAPLLRRGDVAGVLQLDFSIDTRSFTVEQQMAAQHLGNLVANALERIDQQAVRERLFRTEKLAAVGQLISSVAADLKQPLDTISQTSSTTPTLFPEATGAMRSIGREAARAAELVARLVAIAQTEQPEVKVVDLRALLDTIGGYLRADWDSHGLEVRLRLPGEPVGVLGNPTQLEQILVNLLARARISSATSPERMLSIAMSATGQRVQVEIAFTHDPRRNPQNDTFETLIGEDSTLLGFGVLRSIAQTHGGEIRLVRASANSVRYEVELPLHRAPSVPAVSPSESLSDARSPLTVLVVEPNEATRRDVIRSLGARHHRAVPVSNAEEALDLVFRIRFNGAFCSLLLPGSHWVEFFDRVKNRLDFFVLLTDAYDEAASWPSSKCEGFVLRKPVNPAEMGRLLETLELRPPPSGGVQ